MKKLTFKDVLCAWCACDTDSSNLAMYAIRFEPVKGSPTWFAGNGELGIESVGELSKAAWMDLGGVSAKASELRTKYPYRFDVVRISWWRVALMAIRGESR